MKTLTARIFTLLGNRNQAHSAKVPLLIALITMAMVFSFTSCQPDPNLDTGNDPNDEEPMLTYGDFLYIITENNTVTITGYTGSGGNVIIPEEIDGKPVTAIKDGSTNITKLEGDGTYEAYFGVFAGKQLTSVTIPDNITYIGDWAFNFNELASVIISNNVTHIGRGAFRWNKLTSVTIPNNITSIGDWAFSYNELTSVTIPNNVTSIGEYAFYKNELTSVIISDSVTSIGECAFDYNDVTSVTIGANVNISERAFSTNWWNESFYKIYSIINEKAAGIYTRSGAGTQEDSYKWTKTP